MEIPHVQCVTLALETDTSGGRKRRVCPPACPPPRRRPYQAPGGLSTTSLRRNERERNRVRLVNLGFANLQRHVPQRGPGKRMSKVDTLRSAVEYIQMLEVLLKEQSSGDSQLCPNSATGRGSISDSPLSSYSSEDTSHDSIYSEQEFMAYKDWLVIE
ncbi:achaete-scute homolog 1-like [Carcharodon carcharias]|uniref:achaete-scute homolog 1-like n=1 Tax=Carcharodon carcharias TaxID=13397 RepID=UPI001B7E9815|nr:achaete-scute homolog 1-like [Carcharodon carcharias]